MRGATLPVNRAKPFDCVNHSVLLTKLSLTGFRGKIHDFLRSYLTDRLQAMRATDNGEFIQLTWLKSERGIPQGSILGQFLFLLYTNDLPKVTQHSVTMFAGDTSIGLTKNTNIEEKVINDQRKSGLVRTTSN
ncbi:hypothetical protein Trydic_g23590 [Trypoxylus dichotomus]